MKTDSVISVIIAAHNSSSFIRYALDSVSRQTYRSVEAIIIDDGSSDDTGDCVMAFAAQDERFRLISLQDARGPSAARNAGIAAAKGEWIAILDSDDEMPPERLSVLLQEATARSLDLIADNLRIVDFASRARGVLAFPEQWFSAECSRVTLETLIDRDTPGPANSAWPFGYCKPMIRRSFIQNAGVRYREDVRIAEDFLLYSELLARGARFGTCGSTEYLYSVRPDSLSRPKKTRVSDIVRANSILIDDLRRPEGRNRGLLIKRLKLRSSAFWYEQFARSLKTRDLVGMTEAVLKGNPFYLYSRVAHALRLRVCRGGRPDD